MSQMASASVSNTTTAEKGKQSMMNPATGNVTESANRPNKQLAFICEPIQGVTLEDYLLSISQLIDASYVTHASRISGGRICIYLSHKDALETILRDGCFMVKDTFIHVRKYIQDATKIILSNV